MLKNLLIIVVSVISLPALALAHDSALHENKDRTNLPYGLNFYQPQTEITGTWDKEFIRELQTENRDPRWAISLEFDNDGQFTYHTQMTQEVRFINKGGDETVRPVIEDTQVKGTYTFDGDTLVLNFTAPDVPDIEDLSLNLGYNPYSRQAVIKIWRQGEYLALQGLGSPRQIFFRKS